MNWFGRASSRPLIEVLRPLANRCRSYLLAPFEAQLHELEARQKETIAGLFGASATPVEVKPSAPHLDLNLMLHHSRSAFLRRIPAGARVLCSAGCAGNWYFEWVEKCYGPVEHHIGVEYYTPRPDHLPANVKWIANTVSNMSEVADQSCDLIFSGQNVEHLWPEEVVGFLLEAWRTLCPGGHLVMDSPNRALTAPLNWSHPEHTIELTVPEAMNLASLAGFDVLQTYGIWLCRDPRTFRVLPLDPNAADEWSLAERLITASTDPINSLIWWLEARRSSRRPDPAALQAEMSRIFAAAWPERVQRFAVGCGHIEHRPDGDWVECCRYESGAAICGPYFPLRAGRYTVTFDLSAKAAPWAGEAMDPSTVVAKCEVMIGAKAEPIVYRDLRASDIGGSTQVTIDFELSQLEFGVQFRCISLGKIKFACRRGVLLTEGRGDRD